MGFCSFFCRFLFSVVLLNVLTLVGIYLGAWWQRRYNEAHPVDGIGKIQSVDEVDRDIRFVVIMIALWMCVSTGIAIKYSWDCAVETRVQRLLSDEEAVHYGTLK